MYEYLQVPVDIRAGICRYPQVPTDITYDTSGYIRWISHLSHSSSLISPSSDTTTVTSLSFSFPVFERRHLSLKTWMISPSGMSPGILLHPWRTVDARVESSDSLCRSLLTVSPPREKPRSTSHEDARCTLVKKVIEMRITAYQEQTRSQLPYKREGLIHQSHTTMSRGRGLWWR